MLRLYIDGDACPVKAEVYRVAVRYQLQVTLVANARILAPKSAWLTVVVVSDSADAADDWIAEHVEADDIVITNDIPLAGRCLEKQARVLTPKGKLYTAANIGDALAERELLTQLRDIGLVGGGPAPFSKRDRSTFLQRLDELIQTIRRQSAKA